MAQLDQREQVFRWAKMQCQQCDKQYFQMATLCLNGIWKSFCPECTTKALVSGKESIVVDQDECVNCGKRSYFSHMIFWQNRPGQLWCAECAEEVLRLQMKKGNASI